MRILIIAAAGLALALAGQTRLADEQLGRLAQGEGVVVQTVDGARTAMPAAGIAYQVDLGEDMRQVQILTGGLVLSERPQRREDGRYRLRWRANPLAVAVYVDGLRLSPDRYSLRETDLDILEVPGTNSASVVLVDYEVSAVPIH